MHAHCSRSMRLITRIKAGKSPNLYCTQGEFDRNFTVNRAKSVAPSRFRNKLGEINSWLANESIERSETVLSKGREILQTVDRIIIAKV